MENRNNGFCLCSYLSCLTDQNTEFFISFYSGARYDQESLWKLCDCLLPPLQYSGEREITKCEFIIWVFLFFCVSSAKTRFPPHFSVNGSTHSHLPVIFSLHAAILVFPLNCTKQHSFWNSSLCHLLHISNLSYSVCPYNNNNLWLPVNLLQSPLVTAVKFTIFLNSRHYSPENFSFKWFQCSNFSLANVHDSLPYIKTSLYYVLPVPSILGPFNIFCIIWTVLLITV